MKPVLAIVLILFLTSSVPAITIDTVPIGNVGNANDPESGNRYGGVNYFYNMGKFEVTVGQYCAFLNAVAASDTYGLYNPLMATNPTIAGIARSGASGSYSYAVIGSPNHPVTYVSWGDAARFANWLQNGQPAGSQWAATTEDGAYSLNGATSNDALSVITRNTGAQWFIPSDTEWYKAAFYQPAAQAGDADNYWRYPMRTNFEPYSDQPPGATPDNMRVDNFFNDDSKANGYNDGYAVTGSTVYSDSQYYLTDVGAYSSSPSYYGTFDQAGNVWEWSESDRVTGYKNIRGGCFASPSDYISAYEWTYSNPADEFSTLGFRLASISAPDDLGDLNHDGFANAADYVTWRKSNGSLASYDEWRANFGAGGGNGQTAGRVPEQSTLLLFISAFPLISSRPPARDFRRAILSAIKWN